MRAPELVDDDEGDVGKERNQAVPSRRLIELERVSKIYRSNSGDFTALAEAKLSVASGEFVAIVGKSGSGKSTLLNMVTGIDRPTSGIVQINGTTLNDLSENKLAKWRGSNVGLVFQFQQLMPTLTVVENVMLPMDFLGTVPNDERLPRSLSLLEMVGIADQANKFPSALSGGQQQRVAIARALANDPPVIAADEPTGNLDSRTADSVLGLFRKLSDAGKAVVIVTHERDISDRVDRVVAVVDGQVHSTVNGDHS